MGSITESNLQEISNNIENMISNLQKSRSNYQKQQTSLYWSSVKMLYCIQCWEKEKESIENLKELVSDMIKDTESILELAVNLRNDIKKILDNRTADSERQADQINIINENINELALLCKEYEEKQKTYGQKVIAVKNMMQNRNTERNTVWKKIKHVFWRDSIWND